MYTTNLVITKHISKIRFPLLFHFSLSYSLMTMTKALVQSQRSRNKMYEVRAAMTTMLNQIAQQAALLKVAGTLTRSAEIMSSLNSIASMQRMSNEMDIIAKEMIKAGLVEDAFQAVTDTEDMEAETEVETTRLLMEIIPNMPDAPRELVLGVCGSKAKLIADVEQNDLPVPPASTTAEEESEMTLLQARAGAL